MFNFRSWFDRVLVQAPAELRNPRALSMAAVLAALNLAINALGSYVHTSRLQYVEFFGKFFEGGGQPFRPLRPGTKYVYVNSQEE